jgi:hypothetical protein
MRNGNLIVVPLLAVLLAGCFFSPRDAEAPDSETSVPYLDRTDPKNVWDNMQTSLRNVHSPGWQDATLVTDYVYIPDSDAESQFPGVFDGWDGAAEVDFIQKFYSTAPVIDVVLRDPGFVVPTTSGTSVEWEGVIYDLTVTDQGGAVNRYRGKANITFQVEGNYWYVSVWEDLQGESDPAGGGGALSTMGVLRGTIASN